MEQQVTKINPNLKIAQDRHKIYVDKDRMHREFQVGEKVLLNLKGMKLSLQLGNCKKLAARFFGPFEVLIKISLMAYGLDLTPMVKIHNVFHVSLLKKYVFMLIIYLIGL